MYTNEPTSSPSKSLVKEGWSLGIFPTSILEISLRNGKTPKLTPHDSRIRAWAS